MTSSLNKPGITLLVLLAASACSGGKGEGGGGTCDNSLECSRGTVCVQESCAEVSCTSHEECVKGVEDGTFCWTAMGVCTVVECSGGFPCPEGLDCIDLLCLAPEPECDGNTDCRQPAEKCYKGQCRPSSYCEADEDCPNGYCVVASSLCVDYLPDTLEDAGGEVDGGGGCPVSDPPPALSALLCLACDPAEDCFCAPGDCLELDGAFVCLTPCDTAWDCPVGFKCQEGFCEPTGVGCAGCVLPDAHCAGGEACNFGAGTCGPATAWCHACTLDYQCGDENRCATKDGTTTVCMPECAHDTFTCPAGSGCNPREDGVYICVSLGVECCYGPDCDNCPCLAPTPFCLEDGGCAQCLVNTDCPLDHPVCNPDTHACELNCVEPTPLYWLDQGTGQELCVQCLNSLDHCPMGWYCGVDEEDPETYHICYEIL